jgi:hypothetical protein
VGRDRIDDPYCGRRCGIDIFDKLDENSVRAIAYLDVRPGPSVGRFSKLVAATYDGNNVSASTRFRAPSADEDDGHRPGAPTFGHADRIIAWRRFLLFCRGLVRRWADRAHWHLASPKKGDQRKRLSELFNVDELRPNLTSSRLLLPAYSAALREFCFSL